MQLGYFHSDENLTYKELRKSIDIVLQIHILAPAPVMYALLLFSN